jgi:ketosteroid isomerase-like protein
MGKLALAGLLCSLAIALTAAHRVGAKNRAADEEAIRAHIDSVFQAYMRKDRVAVRTTHAHDWRGFIRASRGVVRGIEQYMREAEPIFASPSKLVGYQMCDYDTVFFGSSLAVVNYVVDIHWEFAGIRGTDTLRVLDVYAKENGHWNQAASNVATHPDTIATQRQQPRPISPAERAELLRQREAVWRAWFANDRAYLDKVIPAETIAINAGEEPWHTRESVLAGAEQFAASGARLVRLEFPKTEVQVYGDVAILYTTYLFEAEQGGQRTTVSGRGTEIFVHRDGRWVNSGWHLDSGK